MFSKVLIANRGIIQVQCIQAVKELGATAAVLYVPEERVSVGVRMADEAYELTSSVPGYEYYDEDQIVAIAKNIGADAVHPGYGFLAQDKSFYQKLAAEGICLISSDLDDRQRGITDKPYLKEVAQKHKIPVIAGSAACSSLDEVRKAAKNLDYPIILKAVCGYGGRAIRVVERESDLPGHYDHVTSRINALRLDNKEVFVERYMAGARHVEFPVMRDHLGNTVVLPEIDASVLRRFQKLIVESPSPIEDRALIKELGAASRRLIEKLDFVGLASVEFLVRNKEAWLLEINGYIQPGHVAVTHLTGIDVIKEQIRILAGETLSITQEDVRTRGHVLSLPINAEDPAKDFAPSPGTLTRLEVMPCLGSAIYRTLRTNDVVPMAYASNIAHAVFLDRGRTEVIEKASVSLASYIVEGVKSNLPFLRAVLQSPEYKTGAMDLGFTRDVSNIRKLLETPVSEGEAEIAAALAALAVHENANAQQTIVAAQKSSNYSIWNFASRLLNRNPMEY